MRGHLRESHSQTQPDQPADRRGHFDARQVETLGALGQQRQLTLQMQERRQYRRYRLFVQRTEASGRAELTFDRRFGLANHVSLQHAEAERAGTVQSMRLGMADRVLNRLNLPIPGDQQMRQAFLNRPLTGLRAPVEFFFIQAFRQSFGLPADLVEFLTILFDFRCFHW